MKRKTFTLSLLTIVLAALLMLGTSCTKEKGCTNELATNYDPDAEENDGSCIYETNDFVGEFLMSEICSPSGPHSYYLVIEDGKEENTIILKRFGAYVGNVPATITGKRLEINFESQDTVQFTGSGELINETLTINYKASKNGITDDCTSIGEKRK